MTVEFLTTEIEFVVFEGGVQLDQSCLVVDPNGDMFVDLGLITGLSKDDIGKILDGSLDARRLAEDGFVTNFDLGSYIMRKDRAPADRSSVANLLSSAKRGVSRLQKRACKGRLQVDKSSAVDMLCGILERRGDYTVVLKIEEFVNLWGGQVTR
jgi:hypothetical protein